MSTLEDLINSYELPESDDKSIQKTAAPQEPVDEEIERLASELENDGPELDKIANITQKGGDDMDGMYDFYMALTAEEDLEKQASAADNEGQNEVQDEQGENEEILDLSEASDEDLSGIFSEEESEEELEDLEKDSEDQYVLGQLACRGFVDEFNKLANMEQMDEKAEGEFPKAAPAVGNYGVAENPEMETDDEADAIVDTLSGDAQFQQLVAQKVQKKMIEKGLTDVAEGGIGQIAGTAGATSAEATIPDAMAELDGDAEAARQESEQA